jgi:hypothetical protein
MYNDWITDKSIINKTVANDDNDFPVLKGANITVRHDEPPDQNQNQNDVNERVYIETHKKGPL